MHSLQQAAKWLGRDYNPIAMRCQDILKKTKSEEDTVRQRLGNAITTF